MLRATESPPGCAAWMPGCIYGFFRTSAATERRINGNVTRRPPDVRLANNIRLTRKFRQEYVPPHLLPADDARPGGDPAPPQGPEPHANCARPPRERQPVDDREDREAADESLVRRRAADHELARGGAEEAGEESARGPDPDAEGPVRRGEAAPADGGRRDATLEVLSDAGHAQRASGRLDLGQGDQQPDLERSGPERPRTDPRRRGHGARVPPGRLESPGRARREPVAPLQRGPRDHAGRGHGHRHEVGPDEAPVRGATDLESGALFLPN